MFQKCRKHVYISGKVQGVGFRASVRRKANQLNIKGWVKNLRDGRVEAVFSGEPENVAQIIDYVNKGPRRARVDNVEVNEEEFKSEFNSFQIRF